RTSTSPSAPTVRCRPCGPTPASSGWATAQRLRRSARPTRTSSTAACSAGRRWRATSQAATSSCSRACRKPSATSPSKPWPAAWPRWPTGTAPPPSTCATACTAPRSRRTMKAPSSMPPAGSRSRTRRAAAWAPPRAARSRRCGPRRSPPTSTPSSRASPAAGATPMPGLSSPEHRTGADRLLCLHANRWCARAWVLRTFATVSRLGDGVAWYLLMAAMVLLDGMQGLQASAHMAATGAIALLLYRALKRWTRRPRPFGSDVRIRAWIAPLDEFSFPSGNTLHAVSFTIVALAYYPWLAPLLLPFTLGVAASRVVLGLHYPSVVLAATGSAALLAAASLAWWPLGF